MSTERQQIFISEDAYNYLSQFGSLSYIATRLLYELHDNVFGLPNLRPINRASCKRTNIAVPTSLQVSLLDSKLTRLHSNQFVYFSYSRLLEWAAQTNYPTQQNWPQLLQPDIRAAVQSLYNLTEDEKLTLLQELQKITK